MNERTSNETAELHEDELKEKDLPPRSTERPMGGSEDRKMSTADEGKMSTAELAYGRDQDVDRSSRGDMHTDGSGDITLIQEEDASGFRERWTSIQTHFIDEPRDTVSEADELVAEVIQSLARRFAEERQNLEQQWQSGSEVSTEDLRQAMQHYRSFFERLLAA